MGRPLTFQHTCLDLNTLSNQTGAVYFAGDLRQVSVSVITQLAAASRITIVGSNHDGFTSALGAPLQTASSTTWSIVTVITGTGVFTIDPGLRWLNAFRLSTSSTTVIFAGRT